MNLSVVVPEAPSRRRVTGPVTAEHGLTWSVYRVVDDFEVEVSRGDPVIYTDPTLYSTAHKAERAAKAWCEAYVPPGPEPEGSVWDGIPAVNASPEDISGAMEQELSPATEILHKLEVSGWLIEVYYGLRGDAVADILDLATGQAAPERPAFESADQALEDARTWADANPTRAELANRRTAQDIDAALAGDPLTPFDDHDATDALGAA